MKHKSQLSTLFVALIPAVIALTHAAGAPLPRSTPEAQGISSQAVREFVEALDKLDALHSFMVVRHGQVIAEGWWKPEAADQLHVLNSVSKSFTATAVGMAIADGKLSLDDHVVKFFPADTPADASDHLKAMTVRDLLTMTGGHDAEPRAVGGSPSVKQFLAHPVAYRPGTHFQYNTLGTYTLSAIVTKSTGQTTLEYLKPRLFEPLGIEHPEWASSPEGHSLGGYGLKLRTEDIAKLGQLYLQKGRWNGKQLIPEIWVEQASGRQVPNDQESHARIGMDWQQGYGFQFWRCTHNAYRGDGAGGQFCVVMPDQDMVIAMTAGGANMQGQLEAIWNRLLPACQPNALPDDAVGQQKAREVIAKLAVHPTAPAGNVIPAKPSAPAVLPGQGLAQYDFFYAGEAKEERMFVVRGGKIVWDYTHNGKGEISDALLQPNGNILFAHQYGVTEVNADKQVVWNHEAPPNTEIHTAQPYGTNSVWFVQNGNPAKFVVLNKSTGATEHEFILPVKNPSGTHGQFRHARMTDAGTLLVAHMDMGKATEYNLAGKELWSLPVPGIWSAKQLANGNILVASNNKFVRELNRQGNILWEWKPSDTPEYKMSNLQLAWRLPNGNTLINNWFNQWGGSQLDPATAEVQAIEVTPDKKVVWALRSWEDPAKLGPATMIQILPKR